MQQYNHNLITECASLRVLDEAYDWLRSARSTTHPNNLFWSFAFNWPQLRSQLRTQLQNGTYRFNPVTQLQLHNGDTVSMWQPIDSIVLKAMAMVLTPLLTDSMNLSAATHLKGHGGLKQAVNRSHELAQQHAFVIKTDIGDYYESIDHRTLHNQLCDHVKDRRMQRLLWQVMDRVHVWCGSHRHIKNKSIPRGCPLSPLFAAVYLQPLDAMAQKNDLAYVRYMDDFVIFAKTRHQLRKTLKRMYTVLKELGLKLAPAKTWLGRVVKGISFLGYDISSSGLAISQRSFDRMLVRFNRLYEQGAEIPRLIKYVRNWIKWARSGVSLNVKGLKLKTTQILQNTFTFSCL